MNVDMNKNIPRSASVCLFLLLLLAFLLVWFDLVFFGFLFFF